ncbi:serine/threonine-protein kinase [Georgenia wangjunii]|uniref:serine/threonine-protein kinase n=1 Tax=Georgenia wangjunii TaxID=3117730 RepID=UPI002F26AE6E
MEAIGGYRLVRRIGAGGMGTVHEAVDAEGRHVAIKVLHPAISADPAARERLRREVALLHRVRGSGVARVLDAEVEDVDAFVVTELIDGPTLEEDVREHGPFDADALADLAHGLADGLTAIHRCGVTHRDLKPGNVMLAADGPVIIDFGIAQVADDVRLTQTGLVTGTPGYLDPEVIEGADPGPAGDWWAWAAVLTYAATGRPPFGRGSMGVVLGRVSTGAVDTAGLPDVLAQALRSSLDPEPARRLPPEDLLQVVDGAWDLPALAQVLTLLDAAAGGAAEGPADGGADRAHAGAGGSAGTTGAGAWGAPVTFPGAAGGEAATTALPPSGPPTTYLPDAVGPRPTRVLPGGGAVGGAPGAEDIGESHSARDTAVLPDGGAGPGQPGHPGAGAFEGERAYPSPGYPEQPGYPAQPGYPGQGRYPEQPGYPGQVGYPGPVGPLGPESVPAWAVPPRRRTGTVVLLGSGLSALAASWPGAWALVTVVLLVLLGTLGLMTRTVRATRVRRGPRRGDAARAAVATPWHLLRSVLAALPGVLLGGIVGALAWWTTTAVLDPDHVAQPQLLWFSAALATLTAWCMPTAGGAREGARAVLGVIGRGPRLALAGAALVCALVVAGLLLGQGSGEPSWAPWPTPPLPWV